MLLFTEMIMKSSSCRKGTSTVKGSVQHVVLGKRCKYLVRFCRNEAEK